MKQITTCKDKCCPEQRTYNIYQCPRCECFASVIDLSKSLMGHCSWGKKKIEVREPEEDLKAAVNCPHFKSKFKR